MVSQMVLIVTLSIFLTTTKAIQYQNPVPPCTTTFCALNGARAVCAPPDPACIPPRTVETCIFHSPVACAIWAIGPPKLKCRHACPEGCLPEEHRPVASDGVAYCTDCSFVFASCLSAFSIVGPVARGVENALQAEGEENDDINNNQENDITGGSGLDENIENTRESEEEVAISETPGFVSLSTLSPSESATISMSENPSRRPSSSMISHPSMSRSPVSVPLPSTSSIATVLDKGTGDEDGEDEEKIIPSEIPSSASNSNTNWNWNSFFNPILYPKPSPSISAAPTIPSSGITLSMLCTSMVTSLAPQTDLRKTCCVECNIGCASEGHDCSNSNSVYAPCENGVTCVIDSMSNITSNTGRCKKMDEDSVPDCSIEECTSHGQDFICKLEGVEGEQVINMCGTWAKRTDGGQRPECEKVECDTTSDCNDAGGHFVASDGSKYCSSCALASSSCNMQFSIWGPLYHG